jgi:GntR family transcriptional regulator
MRYLDLAHELRSRIASGVYSNGACIESESELCRVCGVSRTTVRRALALLRRDGLIESRKGAGWFVSASPHRQTVGSLPLAEVAIGSSAARISRRVLAFAYEAPSQPVSAALGLAGGAEVLRVRTLVLTDGAPLGSQTVWLRDDLASAIGRAAFEESSVPAVLETTGIRLGQVSETITAGLATKALASLGVRPGAAVLICRGLARDANGSPVFVFEDFYRGDRMAFEATIPSRIAMSIDEIPG